MSGKCFQTILFWAPFLNDKDLWMQHHLRTKKTENFTAQLLQRFWYKPKRKNPKTVVMSPIVASKSHKAKFQNISYLATVPFVRGCGRTPHPWRKNTSLFWGPESGRIWWLKKVQYLLKKYHCHWTLLRGKPLSGFSQSWHSVTTIRIKTSLLWASGSKKGGKFGQSCVTVYPRQRRWKFKRLSIDNMRWTVTFWILPTWV